jgi:hypothetical protein
MPTPDGFRITQTVPGGEPQDLTRAVTAANWSSNVPGGFGSASLTIPRMLSQKERGLLGTITIEYEGRVLFEGRVEDAFSSGSKTSLATELQAFGLQRLLAGTSVRRVWSLRGSLNPSPASSVKGSSSTGALTLTTQAAQYSFGRFDSGVPTRFGALQSTGAALVENECTQVGIALPPGLAGVRLLFDYLLGSASINGRLLIHSSADGVNYTRHLEASNPGAGTLVPGIALVPGAIDIRISYANVGGAGSAGGHTARTFAMRVLGTPLNEDSGGGFYGGTILRDLIAQVPGLYPGTIEDGSDLALAEVQRATRSSALSLVSEIAAVYARDWAVWEGGRFDWVTPDLKAGGWVVPLGQASAWRIEQSTDGLSNRVYVTFQDAADQQLREASADATSARNPFVRVGMLNDVVVAAPAAMTSVTAPLLAAKLSNDYGRWPDIKGSLTLLAGQMVKASNGSQQVPAFAIRAGDNITIPDLPVEDIYASGQDGQTVFRITQVQASTDGNVELTLEGLTRRADVLMARLGAVS